MKECLTWVVIFILFSLLFIKECRQQIYMIPGAISVVYLFFNLYPSAARMMHRRKLTYEDLEDLQPQDPELQKRFQIVFTRVQQIGGACCAGVLVAYGWSQWHSDDSIFESIGILGGLLSLYARLFGYVGGFCISCLHKMKRKHQYSEKQFDGKDNETQHTHPDIPKPQETKQSNYIL